MNKKLKESIGKVINYLRETNHLTQDELANMLDKTTNYISMIENGARSPSLGLIFAITRLFDISLNNFFAWVEMFYGGDNDDG